MKFYDLNIPNKKMEDYYRLIKTNNENINLKSIKEFYNIEYLQTEIYY